ncbi:SDR family oxidoreductase [Microvirga guangxiensis]|uniref:3-oxoacyl-[acyl-carrier protein] reductase n=1 Tax=Microvirga guangxiensis TaxID=549386 RepID=A0A1G5K0Z6_9HYPH|nr:SDR family oxidoreductase [Microvirga guangxiensis]SCY94313.1 3-oxoacyl-[acyl-carrier protein] reductase [Microvirga guangxiensis]
MDLGLQNKKALVLGASRGLGAAIARSLALEGVEVNAAARNRDAISEWAATLPKAGGRVIPYAVDMADIASVDTLIAALLEAGGVDILINNTGGPPPAPALEAKRSDWLRQFETMAANIFHLTGALLPAMQQRGWGRVISIASSGVEQPIPRLALSNGIRSALIGWSKTLAAEVARDGVTVNVVLPGRIHTKRVDELDASAAQRAGRDVSEIAAESAASIPMGRYGRPEEFADAVIFLASERASYVTGTKLRVDGGATRSI